jgi:hypothetical protein
MVHRCLCNNRGTVRLVGYGLLKQKQQLRQTLHAAPLSHQVYRHDVRFEMRPQLAHLPQYACSTIRESSRILALGAFNLLNKMQ